MTPTPDPDDLSTAEVKKLAESLSEGQTYLAGMVAENLTSFSDPLQILNDATKAPPNQLADLISYLTGCLSVAIDCVTLEDNVLRIDLNWRNAEPPCPGCGQAEGHAEGCFFFGEPRLER